jgi:hypothetical protein
MASPAMLPDKAAAEPGNLGLPGQGVVGLAAGLGGDPAE